MIDELSSIEARLMSVVASVTGDMQQKYAQLQASGVFQEYNDVHAQYASMLAEPRFGQESLKRAIFIQWYNVAEPACFSGICGVNPEREEQVFSFLDTSQAGGLVDPELSIMLTWYYQATDFYFLRRKGIDSLNGFLQHRPGIAPSGLLKRRFNNRGQMGHYWQGLSFVASE